MPGPATPKPSSLAKALANLTRQPVPKLPPTLLSLSLSLAARNAHYGARHFLKEDVPRIAYNNPEVKINVTRKEHLREDPWAPVLEAEFVDGTKASIDMTQKHSSVILNELLTLSAKQAATPTPTV